MISKIFSEIFSDNKKRALFSLFVGSLAIFEVCKQNKVGAIIFIALTLYSLNPKKILQLYKEYLNKKKREKIIEDLNSLGLSSCIYDTKGPEEIKLYFKHTLQEEESFI